MKVWGAIATDLVRRGGAVLISIREARGSTPREAGTRMVVFSDGTFTGTIGGGTLEWRAIAEAQRMLARGAVTLAFAIDPAPDAHGINRPTDRSSPAELLTRFHDRDYALGPELGQCCGGHVTLRFEAISESAIGDIRRLAAREALETFELATVTQGDIVARRSVTDHGDAQTDPVDIEQYGDHPRTLLLFGAATSGVRWCWR